jgi:deoxycytidylate deaminase
MFTTPALILVAPVKVFAPVIVNFPEPFLFKNVKNIPNIYDYWDKPDKYEFACHAEENAILNAGRSVSGSTLYLYSERGYYPCSTCARMIVQSGISEVVMKTATKEDTDKYNWDFTRHMFYHAKIKIRILEDT